jgi:hypothetical protein
MSQVWSLTLILAPGPHELLHLLPEQVDSIEETEDDDIWSFLVMIQVKILVESLGIGSWGLGGPRPSSRLYLRDGLGRIRSLPHRDDVLRGFQFSEVGEVALVIGAFLTLYGRSAQFYVGELTILSLTAALSSLFPPLVADLGMGVGASDSFTAEPTYVPSIKSTNLRVCCGGD